MEDGRYRHAGGARRVPPPDRLQRLRARRNATQPVAGRTVDCPTCAIAGQTAAYNSIGWNNRHTFTGQLDYHGEFGPLTLLAGFFYYDDNFKSQTSANSGGAGLIRHCAFNSGSSRRRPGAPSSTRPTTSATSSSSTPVSVTISDKKRLYGAAVGRDRRLLGCEHELLPERAGRSACWAATTRR